MVFNTNWPEHKLMFRIESTKLNAAEFYLNKSINFLIKLYAHCTRTMVFVKSSLWLSLPKKLNKFRNQMKTKVQKWVWIYFEHMMCVCSGNVLIDLTGNAAKWFVVMIVVAAAVGKQNNNQNETANFFLFHCYCRCSGAVALVKYIFNELWGRYCWCWW